MLSTKFTKTVMLLMSLTLCLSPISALAVTEETQSSTQTSNSQETLESIQDPSSSINPPAPYTEATQSTTVEEDEVVDQSENEDFITIDYLGQTITLPKESTEMADANFYDSPMITEDNQNSLGTTLKNTTRNANTKINWDQSKLPRTDFIDVSSHQGNISVADYNNMKKYGVSGVVVKLTEGVTYRNPNAKNQIDNAKAAGLKVSVYHYSWFKNKQSAEAEADYFIRFANELGLGKDTIMVNDIEEHGIRNKYSTANSIYFAQRLTNYHKINKVVHYSSLSWFTDGTLNVSQLGGGGAIWVAQYPYTPSKDNLLNQNYSSWQWTSAMVFPGEKRALDASIDYTGLFSNRVNLKPEGPYIPFNQYVTITNNSITVWSSFNWNKRYDSSAIFQDVFLAKGKYQHENGLVYYSLYDSSNKWQGYIESGATTVTGSQGLYIPFNKYVTISSKNYSTWSNFNWQKKGSSSSIYNTTLLAKGQYKHFNGSVYYSLYDSNGTWKGYINRNGTQLADDQGPYIPFNQYVTITNGNSTVWSSFSWNKRHDSSDILQDTLLAKGKYQHTNGLTYYSLYNFNGKWQGYIDSNSATVTGPQGLYIPFNRSIKITSKSYSVWSNFNWKRMYHSREIYNQTLLAKGKYTHFNGSVYYSLYDNNGSWKGYINSNAAKLN